LLPLTVLLAAGCGRPISYEAGLAERQAYVTAHLDEIRAANRALLVRKCRSQIQWEPRIPALHQHKQELLDAAIGALCGEDPNTLASQVLALAPPDQQTDQTLDELTAAFESLAGTSQANLCTTFEEVILRGCIAEGMTLQQVQAAWGKNLRPIASNSPRYSFYHARRVRQRDFLAKQGKLTIAMTTWAEDRRLRDFYLTFENGTLLLWRCSP